jgi:dimeric dUTPase (all-alpha-NTP-PPase superfamily)
MNEIDKLEEIFEKQLELNRALNPEFREGSLDRESFLQYIMAMQQETAELVDSMNWKWWKHGEDNWQNARVELVDILHFWVSLCQIAGLSAKDVARGYFLKASLNEHRNQNGYMDGSYEKLVYGVEDNDSLGI